MGAPEMRRAASGEGGAGSFGRAVLAAAFFAISTAAAHAETLSEAGSRLADVTIDPKAADITRSVTLGGDQPAATYVMAHGADGTRLMRNNLGYWEPWDGDLNKLVDNRFAASGGNLTFKVVDQDISDRLFPIRIVIAYRTADALKFGVFQVSPR